MVGAEAGARDAGKPLDLDAVWKDSARGARLRRRRSAGHVKDMPQRGSEGGEAEPMESVAKEPELLSSLRTFVGGIRCEQR